jgi:hypothetical protein
MPPKWKGGGRHPSNDAAAQSTSTTSQAVTTTSKPISAPAQDVAQHDEVLR